MPLSAFTHASRVRLPKPVGRGYSNVGALYFDRATRVGIDSHLWALLKILVDETGTGLWISSVDTGKHARNSRHYTGRAVDVWQLRQFAYGPYEPSPLKAVTPVSLIGERIVRYLLSHSFKNKEGGPWPCTLFGPPYSQYNDTPVDHSDHLHISIPW